MEMAQRPSANWPNPFHEHPSIQYEEKLDWILPREDETMKFMVGSEGVAIEVTQPECPLRVAVKVSWRLEEEVSILV